MSDLSNRPLAWCTTWFLREETLQHSNTRVVNFQYRQPLAKVWGGGTLPSSDGQRFSAAIRSQTARPLPKYFGFGARPDLLWLVLGSILAIWFKADLLNAPRCYGGSRQDPGQRDGPSHRRTHNRYGYTDLIFGLFDLLGLQFSPRLRDIGDQKL
jgi:hypothetical protein